MTSPDFRALCADLLAEYEDSFVISEPNDDPLVQRARAALAKQQQGAPSDNDVLGLMPQQFRDDLACVSRMAAGINDARQRLLVIAVELDSANNTNKNA